VRSGTRLVSRDPGRKSCGPTIGGAPVKTARASSASVGHGASSAAGSRMPCSAMASQEEAGHVDAPCEWWGLDVSAARATLGEEVGVYAAMR
jgi:hypothetical protein